MADGLSVSVCGDKCKQWFSSIFGASSSGDSLSLPALSDFSLSHFSTLSHLCHPFFLLSFHSGSLEKREVVGVVTVGGRGGCSISLAVILPLGGRIFSSLK